VELKAARDLSGYYAALDSIAPKRDITAPAAKFAVRTWHSRPKELARDVPPAPRQFGGRFGGPPPAPGGGATENAVAPPSPPPEAPAPPAEKRVAASDSKPACVVRGLPKSKSVLVRSAPKVRRERGLGLAKRMQKF
jgi:hypothetical protein